MKEKLKTILRFSMRYALIVVPLFLLSLYASRQLLNDLSAKEAEQARMQLEILSHSLDETYGAYQAQGSVIADMPILRGTNMQASYAKAQEGIAEMQKIWLLDMMAHSFFMEYGTDEIYSVDGYSHAEVFFCNQLFCTRESIDRAMECLDSRENRVHWLESGRGDGYLLLHYPVLRHGKYLADSINFLIGKDQFLSLFPQFLDGEEVYFRLQFAYGESIYFSCQGNRYKPIQPEEYDKCSRGHLILQDQAESMDLFLEMNYPQQALLAKVNQNRMINILILALGLLLSLLISLKLGHRQLGKIQQLEKIAQGNCLPEGKLTDEYGLLRELIGQNIKETEESRNSARAYQTALRRQMAIMLFEGQISSRAAFDKLAAACGIEMMEEYFCIMGASCAPVDEEKAAEICGDAELFRVSVLEQESRIIWLEELPNPDFDKKERLKRAARFWARLQKNRMRPIKVTISQVYQDIRQIQYACHEVTDLFSQAGNSILCWNEPEQASTDFLVFEKERLAQFKEALARRNEESSLSVFRGILRRMQQEGCTEEGRRFVCYSIVQEMVQALTDSDDPTKAQWTDRLVQLDIRDEKNYISVVQSAIKKICSYTANSDSFIQQVCSYIQENYSDCNLSAELVAQHIGINKNYLSRLFRAKMGMPYIDYLTQVRMEKACQLLTETDMPIKEIVWQVGYIDDSSFRKKFKARYGIRLSDYRKENRPAEDAEPEEKAADTASCPGAF
ncbi:MAG: helix-turn-helix transcriptional regulator [Clostridia bacterium]|nr:helix-turn-helix transcriptional regulator [Clostridia bacterium]